MLIGGGGLATKAVYSGSIDLNGVASATATITAVVLANSLVFNTGSNGTLASTGASDALNRVELTNTTTVTAYRGSTDAHTLPVGYYVVEHYGGIWKSMQRGVINTNGGTSATATISSVTTANSFLSYLGTEGAFGGSGIPTNNSRLTLTNATTVTAQNNQNPGGTNNVAYQVAESYA